MLGLQIFLKQVSFFAHRNGRNRCVYKLQLIEIPCLVNNRYCDISPKETATFCYRIALIFDF